MKPELRPLVRMLGLSRVDGRGSDRNGAASAYTGRFGDASVVATLTMIGTAAATAATTRLLDHHRIDHVVVVGIAGGVPPAVAVGDLVVPEVVVDGVTGAEHRASPLDGLSLRGRVRTGDDLAVDVDELRAAGIDACDMETAAVAAVCASRGVPWTAFRAISDLVGGPVDDAVLALANPDGTGNLRAAARYLLPRPWKIPGLVRLARDTNTATQTAARAAIRACGLDQR